MFRVSLALIVVLLMTAPLLGQEADPDLAWIQNRILEYRKVDVKAWTKIPWMATLVEARRASQRERAPVFLFTHEGNIGLGRC